MLNDRKSIENTITVIDPGDHKSIYNTFKITLGQVLSNSTNLIAEIAFLQVSLICCLKLSSLSRFTKQHVLRVPVNNGINNFAE